MLTLKKHIALILVLVLMLSSCAQVPNTVNKDGIIIATENSAIEGNEQDELIISNDSTPSPTTKTSTNENLECIISSGGKHIELMPATTFIPSMSYPFAYQIVLFYLVILIYDKSIKGRLSDV